MTSVFFKILATALSLCKTTAAARTQRIQWGLDLLVHIPSLKTNTHTHTVTVQAG